jgi:hypothetical protein
LHQEASQERLWSVSLCKTAGTSIEVAPPVQAAVKQAVRDFLARSETDA